MTLDDVVDPDGPTGGRRGVRAAAKRRKSRRRRTWVSTVIGLAVIVVAVVVAWFTIRPVIASFNQPKDFPGPGSGSVNIRVADGATLTDIGQALQKAGVVKTVTAFTDAAKADPKSTSIQPGLYTLKLQMTSPGALAVLIDPANRITANLTIPEGKRLTEILDLVAKALKVSRAEVDAAAAPGMLNLPPEAKGSLEGWLFPATYEIDPQTTPQVLLTQMVQRTVQELQTLGVTEDKWLTTLTLASLVQAEGGGNEKESPKIARVLVNRLAIKMQLQLDTTVNYALKRYGVDLTEAQKRTPSPYNTFVIPGLPVGPIDSPGSVALKATLNPTPGPWLFFVAINLDTGETAYAVTLADHEKNVAKLTAWRKQHPGR